MSKVIPLPKNSDLPADVAARLDSLPAINVYRMIANAPSCLIPWTDLIKGLYQSSVDIRLREIAILRQAYKAKSEYELHQHKFIAQGNDISEEEIAMICQPNEVTQLSELENTICKMADELEVTATLSDETLSKLQGYFDTKELTELILLTSVYCSVARILNATRVQIEDNNPLAGADSPN